MDLFLTTAIKLSKIAYENGYCLQAYEASYCLVQWSDDAKALELYDKIRSKFSFLPANLANSTSRGLGENAQWAALFWWRKIGKNCQRRTCFTSGLYCRFYSLLDSTSFANAQQKRLEHGA